jgi:hypothetical protein
VDKNAGNMLKMNSALMHRTEGFASFLRFIESSMFSKLCVFIFLSLPEFLKHLYRMNHIYVFVKKTRTHFANFINKHAKPN